MDELDVGSDAELTSDHEMDDHDIPVGEHDMDPDQEPNNIPFDVTELPKQLTTTDGHRQEEVQVALYQKQSDSTGDYIAKFNTAPVQTVTLSKLRSLHDKKDVKGAMSLLRHRRKLVVNDEHLVQQDSPNVIPRIGPHFIDHTLYVGSRRGLDAALPNILADHNWQIILNLTNTHRLWPDSNIACLPFNPLGRMMYIGTRLQEQLWLAMVPNTFFQHDHPANGREQFPILDAPTSTLSQQHALMVIMFIAFALEDMRLQDIHCIERYPMPLTRINVKESTEILGRDGDNNRQIVLRLVDVQDLHAAFRTKWRNWVRRAPDAWKQDGFLENNSPVGVTIRYGQNQPLLVGGAFDVEAANWDSDRDYKHIKQFTFSLATHISYLDVAEWRVVPVENILNAHEALYNKPDTDEAREQVDLHNLPLLDENGFEINVYSDNGLRVPRRIPVLFSNCGALLNLRSVHELFASEDNDEGSARNSVPFYVYPMAFTGNLGNIQSRGLMTNFNRRFTLIDNAMRPRLPDDDGDENNFLVGDGPDYNGENNPLRLGSSVLHGISCQVYNELSHRVRDEAKFHPVQLGMISTAMAGTTAKRIAGQRRWERRLGQCNVGLPHERFVDKVSGDAQPQALRFENTYTLDVHRLSNDRQNGRAIYECIITPLLKVWSHPSVLQPIKDTMVIFKPNLIPSLFAWATYPLTTLIDALWDAHRNSIKADAVLDPCVIEVMSMLERALNYAHTGNAQVLCRRLMDRAWISLGLIHDGLPCISDAFISNASLVINKVVIRQDEWPVDRQTRRPLTSSRRSQELTYGKDHYEAYEARFTIRHAIKNFPDGVYSDIPDLSMRIACYAAEIAIRVYLEDIKRLVKDRVLKELRPILDGSDRPAHRLAKDRHTSLSRWLDEDFPLSYSNNVLPYLLRAVVNTNTGNPTVELKGSHLGRKPLSFLVDLIITQCRTPNSRRRPPFITGGNFLPVMRVAIDEMRDCAVHACIAAGDQTNAWVSQAMTHAFSILKVNHVPWCIPPARHGAPSSVVAHDVWLNLGAAQKPLTQPSASFLTRQESLYMAALQSSEVMELDDPRGDWNALDVRLNKFSSVLHKTVLPIEWDKHAASLATSCEYVIDSYNYVQNTFNPSTPLHQLAIIVAIAFAGLTPKIFAPGIMRAQIPTQPNQLSAYIRGLEWVPRPEKRGATSQEPFITMMSTFVIAMSDQESPISKRVRGGSDIKEWLTKHSAKGITILALCRLGVAEPVAVRALNSARWGKDIRALAPSDILAKHSEVVRLIKTGGQYGGYDAIMYLMGDRTADVLTQTHFVKARPLPTRLPSHTIANASSRTASSSKRTLQDLNLDDSRISSSVDECGSGKRVKRSN
ncbi:hypothetical protein BDR03DRAFT_1018433 [Suillus americanus]|nr:hypothetical protein BDR03DRAFT_1018433 [Suillus americanus]